MPLGGRYTYHQIYWRKLKATSLRHFSETVNIFGSFCIIYRLRISGFLLRIDQSHTCFYGVCRYCKPELSVCGDDSDMIEATVILWLPGTVKLKSNRSPWQRTYKKNALAQWEKDDEFCTKLQKQNRIYRVGPGKRRLLDLVDASVFDFLISNGDRHHYEVIDGHPDAAVLLLDNGKRCIYIHSI